MIRLPGSVDAGVRTARGPRLAAVEVKSGARRTGSTGGLDEFRKRFDGAMTILVGDGGMPLSEFLSVPAPEWLEGS